MQPGYYYVTQNDGTRSILGVETRNIHEQPAISGPITDPEVIVFLDGK